MAADPQAQQGDDLPDEQLDEATGGTWGFGRVRSVKDEKPPYVN